MSASDRLFAVCAAEGSDIRTNPMPPAITARDRTVKPHLRSINFIIWRELCRFLAFGKRNDSPLRVNIWDLRPPVSVEFLRGQHGKARSSPNTLGRILARVLHPEAARMARCSLLACLLHAKTTRTARCPSTRRKTAKTKANGPHRTRIRRLPAQKWAS
jgi:hypothetical protein